MRSRSLPQPPTRTASTLSGRSSNLMNAAKPADGLLSGGQTIALLETLGKSVNGMTEEQAARDMGVQRAASYARTFNSITMLEAAGLVLRDQERVRSAPSSSIGWRSEIAAWAAGQIADRMARSGAHAMQLQIGRIVLNPMQLPGPKSEEHTSELQSLMRSSYAVFCLKKTTTL